MIPDGTYDNRAMETRDHYRDGELVHSTTEEAVTAKRAQQDADDEIVKIHHFGKFPDLPSPAEQAAEDIRRAALAHIMGQPARKKRGPKAIQTSNFYAGPLGVPYQDASDPPAGMSVEEMATEPDPYQCPPPMQCISCGALEINGSLPCGH